MSRVVFSVIGSLGDLHPQIAVGLELRRRGHAVSFCTFASCAPMLRALGFGFHPLEPDLAAEEGLVAANHEEIMDPMRGFERLLCKYILPHLRATYNDLSRAVAADGGADLLVTGELVYPAPLLAEKIGIPWATSITTPTAFYSAYELPVLPPIPRLSLILRRMGPGVSRSILRIVRLTTRSWGKPVRQLRADLGLSPGRDPLYEGRYSPQLVLALFSPSLARRQPDWPPNTVVTGFPFYDGTSKGEALAPELERFLSAGEPPVVFTLGSAAVKAPGSFYEASAGAATLLRRRAVLLVGDNPAPANLPVQIFAADYAPYSILFPRTVAVVHQGGIGTTGQAARAGCPMLVMPFNFDQPDNAERMVRLGVGRTIRRREYTADRAARELATLLDNPAYTQAAKSLGQRMQTERGAETAADALENLLATGRAVGHPSSSGSVSK
jgi:rhamnosyltransferase subunit B